MKKKNEVDVYDAYTDAVRAYDAIPKAFFRSALEGMIETISCPNCGIIFARIDREYTSYFSFNQPMFCCGKMLI